MALDLHEIGPHGERWWALDYHRDGTTVPDHINPLRFCSLADMEGWVRSLNVAPSENARARYRAFLALSRPLIQPFIWSYGLSSQKGHTL